MNIDYHIEVDPHFYSVPYAVVHRELDVRYMAPAGDRSEEACFHKTA
jgi:hypothetical protein